VEKACGITLRNHQAYDALSDLRKTDAFRANPQALLDVLLTVARQAALGS